MSERRTLRVGVAPYSQMDPSCLVKYSEGKGNCEPGMELEILSVIATMMNATLQLKIVPGNYGCGTLDENGSWTGLLGLLQRDEIDITGNLCTIEAHRVTAPSLEASWPVLQHRQGFMIKKPSVEYKFDLTAPFQIALWLTVIGIGIGFVFLSYAVARYLTPGGPRRTRDILWTIFHYFGDAMTGHDSPRPKKFWIMWAMCFVFSCCIYSAYIKVAMLNPVVKYRPFGNHVELADALLNGEYKLLDYKKTPSPPQCHDNSTCEKFRQALKDLNYVVAEREGAFDKSFLGHLVAPDSGNLVLVNSYYWLESYAAHFDARRADIWLIDDELSGGQWFSYFRQRGAAFGRDFDTALIQSDGFKYHVPETYVSMARHVFRGKLFRGDLPEIYHVDFNLFSGPGKCYAFGMILAVITLILEKAHSWHHYHEIATRKISTESSLL